MKDCTCKVGIGGGVIEWCSAHKYSVERDLEAVRSRLKEAEESDAESLKLYRAARDRAERLGRDVEIMKPLVEAAITWKKKERWPYLSQGGFLAHAVDAYEKAVDPVSEREKA